MGIDEHDPIHNVIYGKHGIKNAIRLMYDNEFYGQVIVLIFAGIDAISNIARPEGEPENRPSDFKKWTNKYINIKEGKMTVTPEDLWSARNAVLHTFSVNSKDTRLNKARVIAWIVGYRPEEIYNRDVDSYYIIVSITKLMDEFFKGIDQFLLDILDGDKRKLAEERLEELMQQYPYMSNYIIEKKAGNQPILS